MNQAEALKQGFTPEDVLAARAERAFLQACRQRVSPDLAALADLDPWLLMSNEHYGSSFGDESPDEEEGYSSARSSDESSEMRQGARPR